MWRRCVVGLVLLGSAVLAGCVPQGDGGSYGMADSDGPHVRWSGSSYPTGPGFPGYGGAGGPFGSVPSYRPPFGYGGGGGYARDPFGQRYGTGGGRFVRNGSNVVCDRATQTCYRGRDIDASETRDYFGRKAAREVDRVRDAAGTNDIFRPDNRVVCNRDDRVCYKNGRPDRSETRDYFGKKAARRVD